MNKAVPKRKIVEEKDRIKPSDVHTTIMLVSSLFLVIASQIAVTMNPSTIASRQILFWQQHVQNGDQVVVNQAFIFQKILVRAQFVSLASVMLSLLGILMEFAIGLLVDTNDDLDDTEVTCCCGCITTQ